MTPAVWSTLFLVLAALGSGLLGAEIGQARGERNERRHWHNQLTSLYRSIAIHQQVDPAHDVAGPVKQVIRDWLYDDPEAYSELLMADRWEPDDRHDQ